VKKLIQTIGPIAALTVWGLLAAPGEAQANWCFFNCVCNNGQCRKAPEIDAKGAPVAATLVLGGIAVVLGRRRRKDA